MLRRDGHTGAIVALFLFALWFLFNQGKLTKLGLFGGDPGLMFTEPIWVVILGGMVVHGLIFCVCGGIGYAVELITKRLFGRD